MRAGRILYVAGPVVSRGKDDVTYAEEVLIVKKQSSLFAAMLWMIVISLLLFWLPLLGPFIGGLVGGKKAGSVKRGLAACFLPALIFAVFVAIVMAIGGLPLSGLVLGGIIGGTTALTILFEAFSLVCGAIVGGALA